MEFQECSLEIPRAPEFPFSFSTAHNKKQKKRGRGELHPVDNIPRMLIRRPMHPSYPSYSSYSSYPSYSYYPSASRTSPTHLKPHHERRADEDVRGQWTPNPDSAVHALDGVAALRSLAQCLAQYPNVAVPSATVDDELPPSTPTTEYHLPDPRKTHPRYGKDYHDHFFMYPCEPEQEGCFGDGRYQRAYLEYDPCTPNMFSKIN